MKIQNPHDKFFKETFSNLDVTRDFLENYLPEAILKHIDLKHLEIQNTSHVDEELSEVFSDMLFQTKVNHRDGYLYFLFEHKSYPDKYVALQLLTYMTRIWNQKVGKENAGQLPVIIPLIIYHGKKQWELGNTFGALIPDFKTLPKAIRQMIPDFNYQIYDLSQFSDDDIKGQAQLQITLSILRDIFQKNSQEFMLTIIKAVLAMNELDKKETGIHYFETCMRYILTSGPSFSREQFNTVLKQIEQTYPEGSEVTMTLAEVFRNEGFEEGIEKGETRAFARVAIKSLTRKFGILPAEYREKLSQLDLITLETLTDEIDAFKTIEDVKKFLML